MRRPALLACLLLVPSLLHAQGIIEPRFGLGIGLDINTFNGARPVDIRVPIRLGGIWRVEPSVGFAHSTESDEVFGGGSSYIQERSFSYLRVAVAVTRRFTLDSRVKGYLGPRLALVRNSQTFGIRNDPFTPDTAGRVTVLDKMIGILTGAEFRLTDHLTVGGEVDLSYTFFGKGKLDPDPPPPGIFVVAVRDGHNLETGGALVMRWFFGGNQLPLP
jgi:hypothetical protein